MRATAIELGQLHSFHDLEPAVEEFRAAVLGGLSGPQKRIPAKFFYDAEGSRLFEEICGLAEYYPTRTEVGILRRSGGEIAAAIGPDATLVEFGSGSSVKIRSLLDALTSLAAYVPIDISRDHLVATARACIEMHLISNRHQTVTVAGRAFEFQQGETIHTEDSHKYTVESFHALAAAAGWQAESVWTDADRLFSVHYLVAG